MWQRKESPMAQEQWGFASQWIKWLVSQNYKIIHYHKSVEEKAQSNTLLLGMWTSISTIKVTMEIPQKNKVRCCLCFNHPTPGNSPKKGEKSMNEFLYPHAYYSLIHNS